MKFFERLRVLRKEKNETQRQVAIAISITDRQYQRFEGNDGYPGFENLIALANHFEVTLDYLMCQTDER